MKLRIGKNKFQFWNKNSCAVTEVIGAMGLLIVAVCVVSILYIQVLSNDESSDEPILTIMGRIDSGEVFLEHVKGKPLNLNSEVRFLIGGNFEINKKVRDLLTPQDYEDGFWNIGEKLFYGDILDSDVRVEASIVDIDSNSMVLWGILQDGQTFENKGGLWHLNETSGDIANDSTGNQNNGLVNGANWYSPGRDNGALEFDGLDDLVAVDDSYSLRFSDTITIEAWFQPYEETFSIDTREYNAKFSYDPKIIHIFDDIFAIVGEGQRQEGNISTVRITSEGEIFDVIGDNSSVFADSTSHSGNLEPEIIHLGDGICIISYVSREGNNKQNIVVTTVRIDADGKILNPDNPELDELKFETKKGEDSYMLEISDNVIAVVFGGGNGILNTIEINADGNISEILGGNDFEFEEDDCIDPHIMKLSNAIYSIVYGSKSSGIIKTLKIFDNGQIDSIIDSFTFEYIDCIHPELIEVSDGIFALIYESKSAGVLKTIEIAESGLINPDIKGYYSFEDNRFLDPDIVKIDENIYGVVFRSSRHGHQTGVGIVNTIEILDDGSINPVILSNMIFETEKCITPNIVNVTSNIYAVVYEGHSPHPGIIKTLRIGETSFNTGLSNGVYKENCFGIYANNENIYASINDQIISTVFDDSEVWNHVVLTYNNSLSVNQMKLYVNGLEKDNYTYSETVNVNDGPVIFGKGFYGLIDEIAIYETPASPDDVYWNYGNPDDPIYRFSE